MYTPRPPAPGTPPAADAPPTSSLTTNQRLRVRKLVRGGLVGLVSLQILALGLITTPKADAFILPVFDLRALIQDGLAYFQDFLDLKEQWTSNGLTGIVKDVAMQNVEGLDEFGGHVTDINVDGVSQEPVERAMASPAHRVTIPGRGLLQPDRQTHFGYTNRRAAEDMRVLMPADQPCADYQKEFLASSEGAAQTLRGSVAALNEIHRDMQQDNTRFRDLRSKADRVDSQLALAQVQVDGQLELARQIQRANTINALQTNIYAVVENRRISDESRSVAREKKNGCQVVAMLSGGVVGGLAGDVLGQTINAGC